MVEVKTKITLALAVNELCKVYELNKVCELLNITSEEFDEIHACGTLLIPEWRYEIFQDFNTKDWGIHDNFSGNNLFYFDTEDEANEWVKGKVKELHDELCHIKM